MEEDIKILEPQIKACKECESKSCEQCLSDRQKVQAIENLIARNKKLEEYYKAEKVIWNRKDYIPNSKIKEKIHQLADDLVMNNYGERTRACIIYAIKKLEELLEENNNE